MGSGAKNCEVDGESGMRGLACPALLQRSGSTALSLSSARLWNSFLAKLRVNGTSNSPSGPPSPDRICSANAVSSPPRFEGKSGQPATCRCLKNMRRRRVAHRPVALTRNAALLGDIANSLRSSVTERRPTPYQLPHIPSLHSSQVLYTLPLDGDTNAKSNPNSLESTPCFTMTQP